MAVYTAKWISKRGAHCLGTLHTLAAVSELIAQRYRAREECDVRDEQDEGVAAVWRDDDGRWQWYTSG